MTTLEITRTATRKCGRTCSRCTDCSEWEPIPFHHRGGVCMERTAGRRRLLPARRRLLPALSLLDLVRLGAPSEVALATVPVYREGAGVR
jgi:hypothetical protein